MPSTENTGLYYSEQWSIILRFSHLLTLSLQSWLLLVSFSLKVRSKDVCDWTPLLVEELSLILD